MSLMKRLRNLASGRRGELMVDTLVMCIVVVVFLLTLIEFYGIFIKYQNVNTVARRMTRAVEVSGTTNGLQTTFDTLVANAGLQGATFEVNATFFDGTGAIQLRDHFTVTVNYPYRFNIFSPDFSDPVGFVIPMNSSVTGMSEVFHKP
jgi:hypothetical protein